MSDNIFVNGKKINLDKCDARVLGTDRREKFAYILKHDRQKADVVNKGIDELYIELRRMEREANGTDGEPSTPPTTVTTQVTVGGKEVPVAA